MYPQDREIEVKFSCDAEAFALVLKTLASRGGTRREVKELHTIYFDTPDLRLRKMRSIVRVRHSAGKIPVLCFKSIPPQESGGFNRVELEVPTMNGQPDLSLFPAETVQWLSGLIGKKALKAQFEVRVKRTSLLWFQYGAEVEISADEGNVVSGVKTSPIAELELELKSGEEGGLFKLAADLTREFPLVLSFLNKSERGFRLIGALPAVPLSIPEPVFAPSTALDEIVQTSLSQALHHLMGHWDAAIDEQSPESIHQLRIALRRLRTQLANFSRIFPCREFVDIKQEGKAIAAVLGQLRSLDVLTATMNELAADTHLNASTHRTINQIISQRRAVAATEARALMSGPVASHFVLKARHVIVAQSWRMEERVVDAPIEEKKLDAFVSKTLDIQFKRVLKRGDGFSKLSTRELHSLRLALKALNYTAGAFSYLFDRNGQAKQFQSESLRLQRGLGVLNDNDFALQFCKELAEIGKIDLKAADAALGEEVAYRMVSERKALHRRWKKLKKLRPFWRAIENRRNKA